MGPNTNPWDRLPDEGDEAYAAFAAYRDLGPGRQVVAAYRQMPGKADAKQANGTWNGWAKRHRWAERAREYDNSLRRAEHKGAVKAAEKGAVDWARARSDRLAARLARADRIHRQADLLIAMPTVEQQLDGGRTVVQAINPAFLRHAVAMAREADQMVDEAIDRAMALEALAHRDDGTPAWRAPSIVEVVVPAEPATGSEDAPPGPDIAGPDGAGWGIETNGAAPG